MTGERDRTSFAGTLTIETVTTRDVAVEEPDGGWSTRPCAPPGTGWRVADATSEKRSVWRRVTLGTGDAAPTAPVTEGADR